MSRKLFAATLALTVAGGVYMTAGSAQASNMGFKLERNFAVVPTFQNIHMVSFPLFNGMGDVADSSFPGPTSKCVGDAGGPVAGDGIVNSTDAICELYTDRTVRSSFNFARFNRDTCLFEVNGAANGFSGLTFGGTIFALERDAGQFITVASPVAPPPQNRAVIVGSHDPSYTGRQIRVPASNCIPRIDIINLVYHSMYKRANEPLCGLEGIDWQDLNADGNPDTCTAGIFDGLAGHLIALQTFDNIPDSSVETVDNQFTPRTVTRSGLTGQLQFGGSNFALTPGDAYIVAIPPAHVTTTFVSPHF
jgi:hypothetical protein